MDVRKYTFYNPQVPGYFSNMNHNVEANPAKDGISIVLQF
jgi:hypothetical protein